MDPLPLSTIAELCGGTVTPGSESLVVSSISKDTRTIARGDLYLALRGANFDGNEFVEKAAAAGAAAAIVDRDITAPEGFALIRVQDGQAALEKLAAEWRDRLTARVVAITGSSGKTSTKEFTAAVLSSRLKVTSTVGNLNNHIGLPLTILRASQSDQAAVWEIGMNHPGEIAPLAKLARPDAGIITNIGIAHIEFFENRDGIATEKSELARMVHPDGAVIFPAEDDYASYIAERATNRRLIRCGLGMADITATNLEQTSTGTAFTIRAFGESAPTEIAIPGEHMVRNALLAVAAGLDFGLSLEECAEGLRRARLSGGRLEQKTIRGVRFLDDSYNANPDSMTAALRTLRSMAANGRRIAVLGRMGELGAHAEDGYRRVGKTVAESAQALIAVGPETAPLRDEAAAAGLHEIHEVETPREAAQVLRNIVHEGDIVLVKGSRAARMETVIGEF